jgi:hypothetical protein
MAGTAADFIDYSKWRYRHLNPGKGQGSVGLTLFPIPAVSDPAPASQFIDRQPRMVCVEENRHNPRAKHAISTIAV